MRNINQAEKTKKPDYDKFLKRILKIAVAVIIILSLLRMPRCDREETELFKNSRKEFELVNNYVLENFGHLEDDIILIDQDENGEVHSIYINGEIIELTGELKRAFDVMADAIHYRFDSIKIEKNSISYGGDTYRHYVYSKNGKAPRYFHHKGDGVMMTVYRLQDNWYLTTVNYR